MNKRLLLLFFLLYNAALFAQVKQNPYNLPLINTVSSYEAEIKMRPDHELVNLKDFLLNTVFDIRYATKDNFTSEVIYAAPDAYVRKPLADALQHVEKAFDSIGITLIIYDAYRPYTATLRFYEVYPDTNFVAAPWHGSRHNRGAAVDVALAQKDTKEPLPMPTPFDEFSEKAAPDYPDLSDTLLHHRTLLIQTMKRYGFTVYPSEWWHFDFQGWENFSLMDLSFEELQAIKKQN